MFTFGRMPGKEAYSTEVNGKISIKLDCTLKGHEKYLNF